MWQISTADIFKCLRDESRLRILHLLSQRPLCGCHFIEILGLDQVKVSKLLTYMKRLGMVKSTCEANWTVYRLAEPVNPIIAMNLDCLAQCSADVAKLLSTD
jgi:ArsR family transcriptional regulator